MCAACAQAVDNRWGIPPLTGFELGLCDPQAVDEKFSVGSAHPPSRTISTGRPHLGSGLRLRVEKGHAPAVSYRDWGRGESSPHAREPIASWDEALAPAPADPYLPDQSPSTPSRRQACDRQQDEPVDAYLPRWAIDSGIRRPDGGGRHAAPDDDGDGAARPNFDGAWRTGRAGSRRRAYEIDWRDAPSPESEHTAEWTFDRPQEQGYVGSRRADPADDGSFPGAIAARRPRRSPAGRP